MTEHKKNQTLQACERAVELFGVVRRFIDENPIADYTVEYDEVVCDGFCLAEDCAAAAEELQFVIKREIDAIMVAAKEPA